MRLIWNYRTEEWFHLGEDRLFQLTLTVLVGKFQEVECVFVFDRELRLHSNAFRKRLRNSLIEQRLLVGLVLEVVDQNVLGPD
jgi:hypothetical protein